VKKLVLESTSPFQGLPELVAYDEGLFAKEGLAVEWADRDEAGVKTFTPRERERRCGIVTLECDQPEEVEKALHKAGVIVDSRPGRIRLSPHWCVTEGELERGLDLVFEHLGAAQRA